MISPQEVCQKAERWWPAVLRAWLDGTLDQFFPNDIPQIGLDRAADKLSRFAAIQQEQEALRHQSKQVTGHGYTIVWATQGSRLVGQNAYITRIVIDTPGDFLQLLGYQTLFQQFTSLVDQTRQLVPELEPWIRRYPLRLLDNADAWPNWLAVCRYFRDDYVPDRYYVRQLPVPVHTKFLEERSGFLLSLLATVRPAVLRLEYKDWRDQLGLLRPTPMIRVRALDERFRLDGKHDDFGLPLPAFNTYLQALSTVSPLTEQVSTNPVRRVFICENLLNFLTLPAQSDALALWSGGGFNVEALADVPALKTLPIHYWGDLDAHGFQILNQCRKHFPQTRSLLMDQATFDSHRHLISTGELTPVVSLPHLTDDERNLFNLLRRNNWRVEQERLGVEWVRNELSIL